LKNENIMSDIIKRKLKQQYNISINSTYGFMGQVENISYHPDIVKMIYSNIILQIEINKKNSKHYNKIYVSKYLYDELILIDNNIKTYIIIDDRLKALNYSINILDDYNNINNFDELFNK
jgi:hypothetical protein